MMLRVRLPRLRTMISLAVCAGLVAGAGWGGYRHGKHRGRIAAEREARLALIPVPIQGPPGLEESVAAKERPTAAVASVKPAVAALEARPSTAPGAPAAKPGPGDMPGAAPSAPTPAVALAVVKTTPSAGTVLLHLPLPAIPEPAELVPHRDMPVLGYALSRNGRDYVAYLRWVHLRFPKVGEKRMTECRVRFSLEEPGPAGFVVRGFGRPYHDIPADRLASVPRCELLPVPAPLAPGAVGGAAFCKAASLALSGALVPAGSALGAGAGAAGGVWGSLVQAPLAEALRPLGGGDLDGCEADYYDKGSFVNGDVRVWPGPGGGALADARLTWHGARGGDLAEDGAAFRLALEPVVNEKDLRVLRKGQKADPYGAAWVEYLELIEELRRPRYRTLTLAEATDFVPDPGRVNVFLRRDMDLSMYGALQMAEYEKRAGLRVSYLLNMASSIYAVTARNGRYKVNPMALENLLRLKALGHEVGLQTDTVAMLTEYRTLPVAWMSHEVGKLRAAGLPFVSEVANGSPLCYEHETENAYLFRDFRDGGALLPPSWVRHLNGRGARGEVVIRRPDGTSHYFLPDWTLRDFGFRVSASNLRPLMPPGVLPGGFSDGGNGKDGFLSKLRAARPGDVFQLMTHDNRWTTHSEGLHLTVDPYFEKYYLPELQ